MRMLDPNGQITIVGAGLLGGSIGLGLKAAGWRGRIVGCGRTAQTLQRARTLGCIDEACTDLAQGVAGSRLIVLAAPVGAIAPLLKELSSLVDPDAVITDVGSTKQMICETARQTLARPQRFVGSHPMAGSEKRGPDHASADLFKARPCIITPEGTDADQDAVRTVESLWQMLGMTVVRQSPEAHDRLVAAVSHLPHALAALLVDLAQRRGALDVAAGGFRDTTRIASADPRLWLDIFTSNRAPMLEAIDQFADTLAQMRTALADGDDAAVLALLTRAKETRDGWAHKNE